MTAQEQQMLQGLTERINQTQLPEKDPDAEQYIQQGLGRNPDALYVMAQTILVQQYALDQSQKQLADLKAQQQQAQEPKHATSFLGNLLGRRDEPARAATPQAPPPPQYGQAQYAPVPGYVQAPGYAQAPGYPQAQGYAPGYGPGIAPGYGAAGYGAPGYGQPGFGAPQGGGFLRGAMQTAAGVAAGALAFEGVESLMHGFGHAAGYGSGLGGFEGGGRPEEIVNNYYGDSAPHEHGGGLSSDIEDRRGESQFSGVVDGDRQGNVNELDANTNTQGFDDSANVAGDDQSSADDSGGGNDFADDSSSFDDGGGSDFDSGGGDSGGGDGGF